MADDEPVKEEVVEKTPTEEASESNDKLAEEASTGEAPPAEEPKVEDKTEPEEAPAAEPVAEKEEEKASEDKEPTEDASAGDDKPSEEKPKSEPKEDKPEAKPTKETPEKASTDKDKPVEEASVEKEKSAEDSPREEKPKVRGPKKAVGLPPDKVLLFGKYNMAEVVVHDPGLERYLNLDPIIVAHTGAKHANRSFGKSKMHIIERLVNNMMRTEKFTGKKTKAYKVVKNAFEIIEKRTKTHPVQVFIDALENSAPREEITRLRYGGISVPKAVDTSASRRLDLAFRHITKGAVSSSYKSVKSIDMCLANEIMLAAKKDMNSFAVSKKEELERVAASAR